jgi:hypothetical protein
LSASRVRLAEIWHMHTIANPKDQYQANGQIFGLGAHCEVVLSCKRQTFSIGYGSAAIATNSYPVSSCNGAQSLARNRIREFIRCEPHTPATPYSANSRQCDANTEHAPPQLFPSRVPLHVRVQMRHHTSTPVYNGMFLVLRFEGICLTGRGYDAMTLTT